jgi:hypothetical protein
MNTSFNRVLGIVLLVVLPPLGVHAQSPSLDTLLILPPNPNTLTDVLANVGGIVNISGLPIILTESRRINNDIRLDVLIDELPVLAPAVMAPWSASESFGTLPAGTYNVTARLFWDYRSGPNSSFPQPWTFPDSYGEPLRPGSNGTLMTTFTVVPEPTAVLLASCGAIGLQVLRQVRCPLRYCQ